MTTLPCRCRPACSATAARTSSAGTSPRWVVELANRGRPGDLLDGAGAASASFAGVTPSTTAAMVVMRESGTPSSRATAIVSVPYRSMAAVMPSGFNSRSRSARPSP